MSMGNRSQVPASFRRPPRPTSASVVLAVALVVLGLAGASGCGSEHKTLPPDEELIGFFHAHRVDLDSLRETYQMQVRRGVDYDPELAQRWERLIRRLGLPGGGAVEHVNRIFIPAGGHPLDRDMVDSKGFAWLDSVMPRGIRFDTLASLDTLDPHAFETPGRHIRHLEGHWWLYRWIGARERD